MSRRNREIEAARTYHEATKHSAARLRTSPHFLDWENQPLPFKIYPDLAGIPLRRDLTASAIPALEALAASPATSVPSREALDLRELSSLLHGSAGITKRKRVAGGEVLFRAYPNTGALYHIDLYLVCGELPGLSAGVYHFSPHDFSLRRLREGDHRERLIRASGDEPRVREASAVLVSASTYWRNAWKYRARAYRHCFWDAGTLHANLLALAGTRRLDPRVVLGFVDRPVEELLGLDPMREGALTLVPLGHAASPPPPPPAPPLAWAVAPLSRSEVDYPPIREMHAASSLEDAQEVAGWRAPLPEPPPSPATGRIFPLTPLEATRASAEPLESVIARRGSTRRFDPQRGISLEQLSVALRCATGGIPADFLEPAGSAVELYLIVHAVQGLPPGSYFYRRREGTLEQLRAGEFRSEAGRLGLFQELPAEAAVNVYCLCDLPAWLERLGNRGYRAAQLEGGITGGRLYLAAYAQRLGATGLTFLDDEVTEFFAPHAAGRSVLFLTALGRSVRTP